MPHGLLWAILPSLLSCLAEATLQLCSITVLFCLLWCTIPICVLSAHAEAEALAACWASSEGQKVEKGVHTERMQTATAQEWGNSLQPHSDNLMAHA